jgi:hypothetical protein
MAKFSFQPTTGTTEVITARLGSTSDGTGKTGDVAGRLTDAEKGKFVKLVGSSRYDLAPVGSDIEGVIYAIATAPQDGFSVGSVAYEMEFLEVTLDGLQATPGAGVLAVGDYVLVGTPVAKGTALTAPARVVKATDQAAAKASPFAWRVADLGSANSGAVGTKAIIQNIV